MGDIVDAWKIGEGDHRVLNHGTILDVDAIDGSESAVGSTIVGDELSDDGEGLCGIDDLPGPVERLITHAEGVEVTTTGITKVGAPRAQARQVTCDVARVRSELCCQRVRFPDVHFVAARSETSIDVDLKGDSLSGLPIKHWQELTVPAKKSMPVGH